VVLVSEVLVAELVRRAVGSVCEATSDVYMCLMYHSLLRAGMEYSPQWMKMPSLAGLNHAGG
jgi:hypothetical protein